MQARPYGAGVPEVGAAFSSMVLTVEIIRHINVVSYVSILRRVKVYYGLVNSADRV